MHAHKSDNIAPRRGGRGGHVKIGGRRAVLGARERDTAHAEMDRVPCDNLQNALVLLRRGA